MLKSLLRPLITCAGLLLLWQIIIWFSHTPSYLLPPPERVLTRLWHSRSQLLHHSGITALEILLSLFIGIILGLLTALALQYSRLLRQWFLPLMLISQAIPVYALGPILMLWFGYGLLPKIIITVIIIYFPIATAAYDGLRHTPPHYLALGKILNAGAIAALIHIRLPAALPAFASGIRVAAAIAPIGALIGEYVGGSAGLGYLIQYGINRSQTDLAFAALFVITALTLIIYYSIDFILKKFINW